MMIGVDYIGVSAGAIIVNDKGKYFLAKRANGARDDVGKWEFPGGSVNFFETREEAACRNIQEKHGFEITIEKLLNVYDVIDRDNRDHWLSTTYICKPINETTPKIKDPDKCSEISWFTFKELQNLELSRITQLNVRDILKMHAAANSAL